ncbi:MAG: hypothetical protein ACE5GW_03785 [Planctomycetota bacterium]
MEDWWVEAATSFVPYVNITAQLADKPDQGLLYKKGGRAFPYVVVMDPEGDVIVGRGGGFRPRSPRVLENALAKVREIIDLRRTVGSGRAEPLARARLTLLEGLSIPRKADPEAMAAAAAMPGIEPALIERYRRYRRMLPFQQVIDRYRRELGALSRDDKAGRQAAYDRTARAMYELFRQGKTIDKRGETHFSDYWRLVFSGAILARDQDSARSSLAVYQKAYGGNPSLKLRIDRMKKQLDDLEGAEGPSK